MKESNSNKLVILAPIKLRNERVGLLLACANQKSETLIRDGLTLIGSRYSVVHSTTLEGYVYSSVQQCNSNVPILQVDEPDSTLLDILKSFNASNQVLIVMFATEAHSFMVDGLSKQHIVFILGTAIARFKAVKSIKDEIRKTKTTLENRKFLNKAKGLLIVHRGIPEDEANKNVT